MILTTKMKKKQKRSEKDACIVLGPQHQDGSSCDSSSRHLRSQHHHPNRTATKCLEGRQILGILYMYWLQHVAAPKENSRVAWQMQVTQQKIP